MRALSIRQPYAELILRGIKPVEYRTQPTRIIGRRFYIYAPLKKVSLRQAQGRQVWSGNLSLPAGDERSRIEWMIELAEQIKLLPPGIDWPTGVIVGSAVIEKCTEVGSRGSEVGAEFFQPTTHNPQPTMYQWHLADVQRLTKFKTPRRHPQPLWFNPF